jgi:hypothetical protein
MNQDQKMVATLGLILILFVFFTTYRATLSAILFNGPPSNSTIGPNLGGGIGSLLNPLGGLVSNTDTVQNGQVPTSTVPFPGSTVTVPGGGVSV